MKFLSTIVKFLTSGPSESLLQQRADYINQYALSCKQCRKLAPPILGTGDRYRCVCGNQFAGAKHDLTQEKVNRSC